MTYRSIYKVINSRPTIEGAGVRLRRAFGGPDAARLFDPFLLLDDFGSRYPHEYLSGFPWHPHRGIQTVTYLLKGEVHHEDSTGTKGVIKSGDIQWMSAGSGIFHAEMPKPLFKPNKTEILDPEVRGYQLWINLPSSQKMSDPAYKNLANEATPKVTLDDGTEVRVIAGEVKRIPNLGNIRGPVVEPFADVKYLDINMPDSSDVTFTVKEGYTAFIYLLDGEVMLGTDKLVNVGSRNVVLYEKDGDSIRVVTGEQSARFLLISGKPLGEPVAWYGPIVMNTNEELVTALQELRNGDFIKKKATSYDYFKY
jgi:redox-sensitive bicupin YhaK (pirin superfamily)